MRRGRLVRELFGDDLDGPGRREAHDHLHRLPQPRVLLHRQAGPRADVQRRRPAGHRYRGRRARHPERRGRRHPRESDPEKLVYAQRTRLFHGRHRVRAERHRLLFGRRRVRRGWQLPSTRRGRSGGGVDLVRLLFRAQHGLRRLPLPLPPVVSDCASQQGSAHHGRPQRADRLGAGRVPDIRPSRPRRRRDPQLRRLGRRRDLLPGRVWRLRRGAGRRR
mmetsp:Transcript_23978/g.62545  ORF Transcript_23978/g.62545 Transcript_23978/m.62545 type:complete len:220 (+) Transcript_23978:249-908(+)